MSDASMSPALINPPADTVLGYPGDDDDETATRNESPPVTTPADHDVRPPTKPDPADTDMDPVDGAVAAEPPATAAPEPVPVDSHVQETDRKRELPTDESEHVAKRPRSDASGSQPASKPRSNAVDPSNPLAAYTTFQEPPPPPYLGPTMLTPTQHKFCVSTVRTLKRLKDAVPFLRPVDPIALNIPHYPVVIKRPMDFSTIETKLQNSNPNKTPEPLQPRYRTTDDFVADVRQIFENCYLFNGPEHFISAQAHKLEDILDKQLKQMPADEEPQPPRTETPPPKKTPAPPARRQSTSVPAARRSTPDDYTPNGARPKREIHPPPPKDLPYADPATGKRLRKGKGRNGERDDGTADQLRYCMKILLDFNKKSLYQIASPFYEPVDATYVPNYYKVIRKPMDLSTMRRKLENSEYPNANAFHNDFKQMMRNCQQFNPPGTVVHIAGQEMDRIFKEKWKNLPPLRQPSPEDEDDAASSEEEGGREDTDLAIAMMESQIESIRDNLAALKAKKKKEKTTKVTPAAPPPKEKKAPPAPVPKKPAPKKPATYAPPTYQPSPGPSRPKESAPRGRPAAAPKPPPAKKARTAGTGSDTEKNISTMSFEQKKELSTTIESLSGDKLEKVIQIIYEGMPDLQNSSEEIELDIESLTPQVLTKLWNFVVKPQQQKRAAVSHNGPKRTSGNASKGAAATGGVKRKSMDEEVESARIRKLQEQLNKFDPAAAAAMGGADPGFDDDARSSNGSGSDSDSGSDSE